MELLSCATVTYLYTHNIYKILISELDHVNHMINILNEYLLDKKLILCDPVESVNINHCYVMLSLCIPLGT